MSFLSPSPGVLVFFLPGNCSYFSSGTFQRQQRLSQAQCLLPASSFKCEVFQSLNENNLNPRILYPAKLSFKTDGTIKVFHDKQKLKKYMPTKSPLQKILQGILHTEKESKQNHERAGSTKPQEKKRQESKE
jgi:hypothetical protein